MPRLLVPQDAPRDDQTASVRMNAYDLCIDHWPASAGTFLAHFPDAAGGDLATVAFAIRRAGPYGANHPVYARGVHRCCQCGTRLKKVDD